jgi:anti-anti-sigma factor
MEIVSTEQGDVTVLALSGSLDAMTADDALAQINLEFERQRTKLVIALDGVEFMSSAGLRAILASLQTSRQKGGDLRLAGGSNNIKRMLDFSGFTKILKSYDTIAEAVASFSGT